MNMNKQSERLVLAAAQSYSVAGDIAENVTRHLQFMKVAAEHGVDFLIFPELSLTGYEPSMSHELAISERDVRLQPLRALASELNMVTVVGVPMSSTVPDEVLIAALIFGPGDECRTYTKQHLHSGEESIFSAGTGGEPVSIAQEMIGLAVCADFSHADHARKTAQAGATVYAASVLISDSGYDYDSSLLSGYAQTHRMPVLMVNHAGVTGGWQSAGRSAFWSETGKRVAEIRGAGEGLLMVVRTSSGWSAHALAINV